MKRSKGNEIEEHTFFLSFCFAETDVPLSLSSSPFLRLRHAWARCGVAQEKSYVGLRSLGFKDNAKTGVIGLSIQAAACYFSPKFYVRDNTERVEPVELSGSDRSLIEGTFWKVGSPLQSEFSSWGSCLMQDSGGGSSWNRTCEFKKLQQWITWITPYLK